MTKTEPLKQKLTLVSSSPAGKASLMKLNVLLLVLTLLAGVYLCIDGLTLGGGCVNSVSKTDFKLNHSNKKTVWQEVFTHSEKTGSLPGAAGKK